MHLLISQLTQRILIIWFLLVPICNLNKKCYDLQLNCLKLMFKYEYEGYVWKNCTKLLPYIYIVHLHTLQTQTDTFQSCFLILCNPGWKMIVDIHACRNALGTVTSEEHLCAAKWGRVIRYDRGGQHLDVWSVNWWLAKLAVDTGFYGPSIHNHTLGFVLFFSIKP